MADKTVNTKIQLRYDTLTNWNNIATAGKGGNYVPKAGEMCIVQVNDSVTSDSSPIWFKVGDGSTAFSKLKYGSALASDVYSWAKKQQLNVITSGTGTFVTGITSTASGITVSLGTPPDTDNDTKNTVGNVQNTESTLYLVGSKTINLDTAGDTYDRSYANGSVYVKGRTLGIGDVTNGLVTITDGTIAAPTVTTETLTATAGLRNFLTGSVVKIPDENGTIITSADTSSAGDTTLAWGEQKTLATIDGTKVNVTMPAKPSYDNTTYTFATGTTNGAFSVTPSSTGKAQSVKICGLNGAAYKSVDTSIDDSSSANLPTSDAVKTYVADQISGKSSVAYVIDSTVSGNYCNTAFNIAVTGATSVVTLTSGTLQTIDSKDIGLGDFKVGDILYTKAADIKDWFFAGATKSGDLMTYTFYQISGDTPVLDGYVNALTSATSGDYVSGLSKSGSTLTASKSSFNALSIAGIAYTPNASATVSFVGEGATTVSAKKGTVTISSPNSITGVQFQINKSDASVVTPSAADGTIAFSVKGTNLTVTKEAADNAIEYTIAPKVATAKALGAIKTGYTTSGKDYKVDVDSSGNAYVNVPWENTDTWRSVKVNGDEVIASNASTPLYLATNSPSWGSFASTDYINIRYDSNAVQLTTGAKVVTTDDVLILNGGSATTVI